MTESHSTPKPARSKPAKPYPEFPLTAHPAGHWCKKVRGKVHYFGRWEDPDAALAKYLKDKDALHAGRKPRPDTQGLTVHELCNKFLLFKEGLIQTGELAHRSWVDYRMACHSVLSEFGKKRLVSDLAPEDFGQLRKRLVKNNGPVRLGNVIQRIRSLFKFAFDAQLIDRPVTFGPEFKKPSKKALRRFRAKQGKKLFNQQEIHELLDAAGVQLKAMILLGVNCGFGNSDVSRLPLNALDLERRWADFPRPKTGTPRRCPLWPETVAALKVALDGRPEPKDKADAGLAFVTKYGSSWAKETHDNPVSKELAKLLRTLRINGRKGLGFYTLRHVFETIGGASRDQVAVDAIMGHARDDMASVYRQEIEDERLQAVVDHVRTWLFGKAGEGDKAEVLPMANVKKGSKLRRGG